MFSKIRKIRKYGVFVNSDLLVGRMLYSVYKIDVFSCKKRERNEEEEKSY